MATISNPADAAFMARYNHPQVMGILNVTPDSFYAASRRQGDDEIAQRARQIVDEGATIIDVGAYSTRPDAAEVTAEEELSRLRRALPLVRSAAPGTLISVDTFRADVARCCVEELGADIINDVSGGTLDAEMFPTVARLGVPYILMHMRGTPKTMQQLTDYHDLVGEVRDFFTERIRRLNDLGFHRIILDPGYGFAKTLDQNYELFAALPDLCRMGYPLLVGISRKSMIYRFLGGTPDDALNGTTVLNTLALQSGAAILRVHDVRPAVEALRIVQKVQAYLPSAR
jgi:dihydropteroate synthase